MQARGCNLVCWVRRPDLTDASRSDWGLESITKSETMAHMIGGGVEVVLGYFRRQISVNGGDDAS
jgi:hypothetical protein